MEAENRDAKSHYCVIFTQTLKQWDVTEVIRRSLPEDKGIVFYPCVELWMGSLGQTVIEPLFPGYVFIRSNVGRRELHELIRLRRREILSFVKEVWINEKRAGGEDAFAGGDDEVADLTDEEAEFLDFMLGFRYENSEGEDDGSGENAFIETEAGETDKGKKIYRRKLPKVGVLAMSRGYRDADGHIVVMEGPLKGREDYIANVKPKERRAYLNLQVGGRRARAGLELKGKRYWYPNDKNAPVILDDGYEVSPKDIAAAIMRPKH